MMCDVLLLDYSDEEVEEYIEKAEKILLEPYQHLSKIQGKNIRHKLCAWFNYWFHLTDEQLKYGTEIVSTFHNMSLLIDDIQDNSFLRRGLPAAHVIYGVARTFVAANRVSADAAMKTTETFNVEMKDELTKTGITAIKGQIMDTYWRDNFICPTEEEYIDMIVMKTGCIFQLSITFMKAIAGTTDDGRDFTHAVNLISIYFQILDDYYNLKSEIYYSSKGFCEDLTEGKFSFPIIHGVNSNLSNRRIYNIVKLQTTDIEIKKECLKLLEEYGSFEYTRNKLKSIREEIEFELNKFGKRDDFHEMFDLISGNQEIVF